MISVLNNVDSNITYLFYVFLCVLFSISSGDVVEDTHVWCDLSISDISESLPVSVGVLLATFPFRLILVFCGDATSPLKLGTHFDSWLADISLDIVLACAT